eukprot:6178758-Pleurochrysis_carterae.AAC.1
MRSCLWRSVAWRHSTRRRTESCRLWVGPRVPRESEEAPEFSSCAGHFHVFSSRFQVTGCIRARVRFLPSVGAPASNVRPRLTLIVTSELSTCMNKFSSSPLRYRTTYACARVASAQKESVQTRVSIAQTNAKMTIRRTVTQHSVGFTRMLFTAQKRACTPQSRCVTAATGNGGEWQNASDGRA